MLVLSYLFIFCLFPLLPSIYATFSKVVTMIYLDKKRPHWKLIQQGRFYNLVCLNFYVGCYPFTPFLFDYVSCSPFRVPIARLAAAQAAIKDMK